MHEQKDRFCTVVSLCPETKPAEFGNLLTDSEKIDIHAHISKFSPSASVNGEMKKKWVIKDGTRYLVKVNANDYGQQAVNEIIACRLHEKKQGWENFVPYTIQTAVIEGKEVPCSVNPLFTSSELELVSAYQLIRNYKVWQDCSDFEAVIHLAVEKGMNEAEGLLTEYTCMPKERAGEIAQTIRQKIEYLKLFRQGKKIWKQKAYW